MNFAAPRTWAGIGFVLLFLINAGLVIAGLIFDNLWCTLSGMLMAIAQFWLHKRLLQKQNGLAGYSLFSDADLRTVIGRSQTRVPLSNTGGEESVFDFGYSSVQCGETTLQIAGNMLFTEIGMGNCRMPYRMNLLNIGLSNVDVPNKGSLLALSRSAKGNDCAINTGVVGIVPELLRGGSDLVWRIDRLEALYRNPDGSFNEAVFGKAATRPYIKMIEVKLKAAHFSPDISESSLNCLITFLERIKVLSGGKPTGVCLAVADHELVARLCHVMASNVVYLDFVTIESAPGDGDVDALFAAINAARLAIDAQALPTKVIASGDLAKERDILRAIGYGAHACYSVRPFQVSLAAARGLIRSTTNSKVASVTAFHQNTLAATMQLITACATQQQQAVEQEPISAAN
ncbi:hypothetical protein GWR56_20155 [Mucilaginibacter sp. 14171R-50]|uniref:hypothetical protein n=1 Tax=Mucilaginibacter sp. 14171R-50 TaxID=2703789 RepID=UPI00138CEDCD|nr:hypothetical protein [Mucilaginibacter sp. 14171R-50]QHS57745.1 hypothetical protein GWR56_20155 [Mucilaginibacter sp. 14171R-50]